MDFTEQKSVKTETAKFGDSDDDDDEEGGEVWTGVTNLISSKVEGEAFTDVILESEIFPFFILSQTAVALLLWMITVQMEAPPGEEKTSWTNSLGGLERFWPGQTDLQLQDNCDDYRGHVWRWLTYQYSHVGITHIGSNCALNLILGVPLELLHGSWKACLMYNIGVLGGALAYFAGDARNAVVGMSGGCYSLIGLHLAYTIINWAQRRYRKVVVFSLILLVAVDMSLALGVLDRSGRAKPSNSAHLGGAIAGLVMGIVLGENLRVKPWEVTLKWVMLALGIILATFCLAWGMIWVPAPIHDSADRFCWYSKVYNATLWTSGTETYWRCVRCADQACIDRWSLQEWTATTTRELCSTVGYGN